MFLVSRGELAFSVHIVHFVSVRKTRHKVLVHLTVYRFRALLRVNAMSFVVSDYGHRKGGVECLNRDIVCHCGLLRILVFNMYKR
jgi:hypothetical protein